MTPVDPVSATINLLPLIFRTFEWLKKKLPEKRFNNILTLLTTELLKQNPNLEYVEGELQKLQKSNLNSKDYYIVKGMAQKASSHITRKKGYLYYQDKKGNIAKAKMTRIKKKGGAPKVTVKASIKREKGYLYFIDKHGDVAKAKMGRSKKKITRKTSKKRSKNKAKKKKKKG